MDAFLMIGIRAANALIRVPMQRNAECRQNTPLVAGND
jgi:hypothetical protein